MRNWAFEFASGGRDAAIDETPGAGSLTPDESAADTVDSLQIQLVAEPDPAPAEAPSSATPPGFQPDYASIHAGADAYEDREVHGALAEPGFTTTSDGVSLAQILHDRPDVFQLFFTEYYGPNNDHNSSAWLNRVGAATPEAYARYWYETGGRETYAPSSGESAHSPIDPSAYAGGRTTADGVYLDQILHDRPDVFQLFFSEYYGPNNDRHSPAWMDRVGGATPQDYANYWYERGGRFEYQPEPVKAASEEPAPVDETPVDMTPIVDLPPAEALTVVDDPAPPADDAMLTVGQSLSGSDDPILG